MTYFIVNAKTERFQTVNENTIKLHNSDVWNGADIERKIMTARAQPDEIRTLVPVVPEGEIEVLEYDHETARFCRWHLKTDGKLVPMAPEVAPSP